MARTSTSRFALASSAALLTLTVHNPIEELAETVYMPETPSWETAEVAHSLSAPITNTPVVTVPAFEWHASPSPLLAASPLLSSFSREISSDNNQKIADSQSQAQLSHISKPRKSPRRSAREILSQGVDVMPEGFHQEMIA